MRKRFTLKLGTDDFNKFKRKSHKFKSKNLQIEISIFRASDSEIKNLK